MPGHAGALELRKNVERTRGALQQLAEHTRRAEEVVRSSRAQFRAGRRKRAIDALRAFSPPHQLVASALTELTGELADLERREQEQEEALAAERARKEADWLAQAEARRREEAAKRAKDQEDAEAGTETTKVSPRPESDGAGTKPGDTVVPPWRTSWHSPLRARASIGAALVALLAVGGYWLMSDPAPVAEETGATTEGTATDTGLPPPGTVVVDALPWAEIVSVVVGHVGDSRVYLLADGTLRRLTQDDSWAATILAEEFAGDEAGIANHPMRNALTNVLGARDQTDIHMSELPLQGESCCCARTVCTACWTTRRSCGSFSRTTTPTG